MKYEKPLMSVTELTQYGYSRDYLNQLANAQGAPVVWTPGGGKVLFDTEKLEEFMKVVNQRVMDRKKEKRDRRCRGYRRKAG